MFEVSQKKNEKEKKKIRIKIIYFIRKINLFVLKNI